MSEATIVCVKIRAGVSEQQVKDALKTLGTTDVMATAGFRVGEKPDESSAKTYWVLVEGDEELAYLVVAGEGQEDGQVLEGELLAKLSEHGVCVSMASQYPRADRYGCPLHASTGSVGEGWAMAEAGEHFRVAEEGFEWSCMDTGDDNPMRLWLKVLVAESG